jgi:hypothetical protein
MEGRRPQGGGARWPAGRGAVAMGCVERQVLLNSPPRVGCAIGIGGGGGGGEVVRSSWEARSGRLEGAGAPPPQRVWFDGRRAGGRGAKEQQCFPRTTRGFSRQGRRGSGGGAQLAQMAACGPPAAAGARCGGPRGRHAARGGVGAHGVRARARGAARSHPARAGQEDLDRARGPRLERHPERLRLRAEPLPRERRAAAQPRGHAVGRH